MDGGRGNLGGGNRGCEIIHLDFPIANEETHSNNEKHISPSVLPNFHGLRSEDP
jgi:hypothetical protein